MDVETLVAGDVAGGEGERDPREVVGWWCGTHTWWIECGRHSTMYCNWINIHNLFSYFPTSMYDIDGSAGGGVSPLTLLLMWIFIFASWGCTAIIIACMYSFHERFPVYAGTLVSRSAVSVFCVLCSAGFYLHYWYYYSACCVGDHKMSMLRTSFNVDHSKIFPERKKPRENKKQETTYRCVDWLPRLRKARSRVVLIVVVGWWLFFVRASTTLNVV